MVSGPLTDGCYGRGQSRTAANRQQEPIGTVQSRCRLSVRTAQRPTRSPTPRSGANGRSVRCVRCQTVWHAVPPAVAAHDGIRGRRHRSRPWRVPAAAWRADLRARRGLGRLPRHRRNHRSDDPSAPTHASKPTDAAAGRATPRPVALADIPIPVEDAPPLVPAAGDGTAGPLHVAGRQRPPGHRERGRPPGSRHGPPAAQPLSDSAAARDRCSGQLSAWRCSAGARTSCGMRRSSHRSIVPSGCR